MCILIWAQPVEDSKANHSMEDWQNSYVMEQAWKEWGVFLWSLSVYEYWSVCEKTSNWTFLLQDVHNLTLPTFKHLRGTPFPCVSSNKYIPGCYSSVRETKLVLGSPSMYVYIFFIPSWILARVSGPTSCVVSVWFEDQATVPALPYAQSDSSWASSNA